MNILILGGDGFIGSHLAHYYESLNHVVYVVDKEDLRSSRSNRLPPQYIYNDLSINTYESLSNIIKSTKPDFIFNCVAVATPHYYVQHPIDTFNLDFTVNYDIIKTIIHHKIPFMHFSTSEVYGKTWTENYDEYKTDLVIGPTHKSRWIYATSKILLEQLINAHKSDFVIVRPQNFFGWDMDWLPNINTNLDRKWKPRLPACILNSLFTNTPIHIVKPGTQQRCYTYIDDAIEGLYSIVNKWDVCKNHVINIGNKNNETSIQNIVSLYIIIWNELHNFNDQHTPYPILINGEQYYGSGYEDCVRRMFDDSLMVKLTGWSPQYNLKESIRQTIINASAGYFNKQI